MEDLRAAVAPAAAVELAGLHVRDPVVEHSPGLRRLGARVLALGMLRPGQAVGLAEAHVERAAVRRLVRDRAFQDEVAVLLLVEAELDEGADIAPALRRAVDDGVLDRGAERVALDRAGCRAGPVPAAVRGVVIVVVVVPAAAAILVVVFPAALAGARAVAVAQERDEVARRREAEPQHHGVLRGVKQLVNVVAVEIPLEAYLFRAWNTGERYCGAIGKGPIAVRNGLAGVVLVS